MGVIARREREMYKKEKKTMGKACKHAVFRCDVLVAFMVNKELSATFQ